VVLREALATSQKLEESVSLLFARSHLALTLSGSPEASEREEARALAREWLEGQPMGVPFIAMAQLTLARVALACGEFAEAEARARQAWASGCPYYQLLARTPLSAALLARGRATEARQEASLGVQELEDMGDAGAASVGLYLALAEACFLDGDNGEGEAALRKALRHLHARAADIPEGPHREHFLHQVPENARSLSLARERWGSFVDLSDVTRSGS
jgi:eukaryotic-like serine/threonine-protein kinase